MDRRTFLHGAAATALTAAATTSLGAKALAGPNERIRVCVMGVRGRGGGLLSTFAALPEVEVRYVCDVDQSVLVSRGQQVADTTGKRPQLIQDFRHALDDKQVDAFVIGTPDHWHALPTIYACQAGKDVYVEKPDGHNILEGRVMVAAAKKHGRVVQLGTQSRSGVVQKNAMDHIAAGKLGKVRFARAWESARQGNIGKPADSNPPDKVDYDMWLGPAPQRPFNERRFHGHWRWFFDYGAGDLGNDGVHRLDVARWGLETAMKAQGEPALGLPRAVSAHGGKLYFDDMQQWPDTLLVTYDFPNCVLTYEMRLYNAYRLHDETEGCILYGDEGYVVIGNRRWRAFDARGKQISEESGNDNTVGHAQNFLDCMRSREKPVADLETIGHPSSLLCHLGNAAWRLGRTVRFDPQSYTFDDEEANQYLTRPQYRAPWLLPKVEEV